jgi:hypothetical protein
MERTGLVMASRKPFALRLAGGKEHEFQDGYDLWAWFMARQGIRVARGESKTTGGAAQRQRTVPRKRGRVVRLHRNPFVAVGKGL